MAANKHHHRKKLLRQVGLPLLVSLSLIMLWQIVVSVELVSQTFLPSPWSVAQAIVELYQSGLLFQHAGASLFRVFMGFFLAALLAIPIGMLIGWHLWMEHAFMPTMQFLRTISPIAWIPLAILWFGIGDPPAIFIIFMTSFFPILIATAHANRHLEPALIKTAINFGARGVTLLFQVILPASLPYIMVGLRIALGIAWVVIVAAEMVGMRSGLGYMILDARNALRVDMVIAGMIIIGWIGLCLDYLMGLLEKRLERHKAMNLKKWTWNHP